MFVNRFRDRLKGYEVFNLSHRGYNTDQELLTFNNFRYGGPIRLVVLMFCENGVRGNNTDYEKYKPKFEIVNDELVLMGVPVPKVPEWSNAGTIIPSPPASGCKERVKKMLFKSYFIHDLYFIHI
jgi:hypothetical protein